MENQVNYTYNVNVVSVYDGDTITVDVDLGFKIWAKKIKVRLWGINTPEIRGGTAATKAHGKQVTQYVRDRILNKAVVMKSNGKGKYGRWLGVIYVDGVNLNEELVRQGMAVEYMKD